MIVVILLRVPTRHHPTRTYSLHVGNFQTYLLVSQSDNRRVESKRRLFGFSMKTPSERRLSREMLNLGPRRTEGGLRLKTFTTQSDTETAHRLILLSLAPSSRSTPERRLTLILGGRRHTRTLRDNRTTIVLRHSESIRPDGPTGVEQTDLLDGVYL